MLDCPVCHNINFSDAAACRSCGASLAVTGSTPVHALPCGTRLQNGAFEIEMLIGQGERGLTYRGRDTALQRVVAIKEFFPFDSVRNGECVAAPLAMSDAQFIAARENFERAASVPARFSDESIVRVFRVFEEHDSIYLVMEFLEGQTLAQKLARGALPVPDAMDIGMRLARALSVIHDAQMLQHAIAPAHIVLTRDGRVVLTDFVAAADISSHANALTSSGYVAPECFQNASVPGPAADIYSLGATLYHALVGSAPAPALERLAGKALPPPAKINSQVSPELSNVILQSLHISPENRFPSARDFARALKASTASGFSLAPAVSPHAGSTLSGNTPRTPAAPPRGASAATIALPPEPPPVASTVVLPPFSNPPASAEKTTSTTASGAGSTPSAPRPRAAWPSVPRSTPTPTAGTQFCPHCSLPMPTVMSRCPHCRQLKKKSFGDPASGTFREWHRNENTRIGLGWALAIGFALLILLSMWRGCESLGLKPQRIPQHGYEFMQRGSTPVLPDISAIY